MLLQAVYDLSEQCGIYRADDLYALLIVYMYESSYPAA